MHIGLRTGPLCPMFCTKLKDAVPLAKFQMALINLWEPCYSDKVPDDLQTYNLDVLWLQEEEEEGGGGGGGEEEEEFPSKGASLKVPFMESQAERCPTTRALLHSPIKVPGIRAPPHIPGSPQVERGPHGERRPHPETFLTYLPGSPVMGFPPEALSTKPLQRQTLHSQSPFIHLSRSPVEETSSRFSNGAPMKIDASLQSIFYTSFRVPSKEALPPGSLHRAPIERDTPPPEPISTISQSPR